jgi:hypothetical protein
METIRILDRSSPQAALAREWAEQIVRPMWHDGKLDEKAWEAWRLFVQELPRFRTKHSTRLDLFRHYGYPLTSTTEESLRTTADLCAFLRLAYASVTDTVVMTTIVARDPGNQSKGQ